MTKHRRITGFVAVAVMAVVATVAATRSHSTDGIVVSASTIATADFDDRWSAISPSPSTGERTRN